MKDMRKTSKRIVSLLAAFGTIIGMSAAAPAATQAQSSDLILTAQEEQVFYDGKQYINIISPKDVNAGGVYCQGQAINYQVKATGSYDDYSTRPYVTLFAKKNTKNLIHSFTYPEDLAKGSRATFKGNIATDNLSIGELYTFGVMNYPFKNGKKQDPETQKIPTATVTVDISIRAHKYDSGKVTKAATCTEDGVKTYTCEYCGGTKTEVIPATGHTWDAGTITEAPDTGEAGVKTYTCLNCGEKRTEAVSALTPTIKKTPAGVKAKAKKKTVTVTWKKIKKKLLKQIKSIEVQYSTNRQFTRESRLSKRVGKNKTKAVLKLKAKTTYYIRVRYVGADGTSKLSKIRKVKTK